MNSHSSPEAAAGCLEHSTCLDGGQSDTSSTTRTVKRSLKRGLQTAFCTMRQSSGTFENLSAADAPKRIAEWLTLSAQDSRVSRSASPENNAAPTTSETCGLQLSSAFAWFDRDFACWKTCQGCLVADISDEFSETWPRAGMTRDGACYQQPKWERGINETGCGLWPTPRAMSFHESHQPGLSTLDIRLRGLYPEKNRYWPTSTVQDSANNAGPSQHHRNSKPLNVAVLYPTPTAGEHTQNKSRGENAQLRPTLVGMARYDKWPTPKASANENRQTKPTPSQLAGKHGLNLACEVNRAVQPTGKQIRPTLLNPDWVEWLMGWPVGWTGLEPLAMDRFHWWLRSHGVY